MIRKSSRQLHGLAVGQSVPQIHCKLKLETIFRSENVAHLQEATLRSADVIIACAEAGVRSLRYRPSRRPRAFLKEFSASNAGGVAGPRPTPQIAKFRLEAIQTGKGKSYMHNPIVQQFLEGSELQGSELDAPTDGKRLHVYFAGLSGLSAALAKKMLLKGRIFETAAARRRSRRLRWIRRRRRTSGGG
jgi:hypothetical protein